MILITGASGNVGREVVRRLHETGGPIRVLVRNPSKATWPDNVEVIAGDLTDSDVLKVALNGVKKAFLLGVPGGESFAQTARTLGVEHIVFLSSSAVGAGSTNIITRLHANMEHSIRQSGVRWTFLRPGSFMSNALQWAGSIRAEGVVRAPFGDAGSTPIDPRDIAAVAVESLISSGHEGKIYPLTGPEVLTPADQVQTIGDVLGRPIVFESISESAARENMKRFMSEEIADAILQKRREDSAEQAILRTVGEVTGQAARTFRQWVIDNRAAFS